MKESRISLLLLVSLSLLLLASVVLFIRGFAFYKKNSSADISQNNISAKAALELAAKSRDSLQKVYDSSIAQLNDQLDATKQGLDSIQENMNIRLLEFSQLKMEIGSIFQQKPASSAELAIAQKKINELGDRMAEWRRKYADVDEENKRLNRLIAQFSQQLKETDKGRTTKLTDAKSVQQNNSPAAFLISGLQFKAIMQTEEREQETNQAVQTDELKGSFDLKAPFAPLLSAEIFIVVLQPDGKVMKRSAWESGLFETGEGRKIYSQKLSIDCGKAESQHLNFSIAADDYQKGSYIFQLYHNGRIIASTSKILS